MPDARQGCVLPKIQTEVPGPRSLRLAQELRRAESRNVTYVSPAFPVFWERAKGQNVWDVDGNRYLDLTSGFGVATAGFTPAWGVREISAQAAKLYHGMGDVHPTMAKAKLCRELSQMTFERWGAGDAKVILGCSGSDAVEAALKTACLLTKAEGVLAFEGGYHGLGYGAMTVTGRHEFRHPWRAQLKEFATFLPYPTRKDELESLEQAVRKAAAEEGTGALIVEPVQGRGGERIAPKGFLNLLRRVCDEMGMMLIFDEIYTGFYRTGPLFACEYEGVVPDVICLAKALTGGYPLSACVGNAMLMDAAWPKSEGEALHTSTFLGNPLGCALALASLREWRRPSWSRRVKQAERWWRKELARLKRVRGVREVRGRGLLWGIELGDPQGRPDGPRAGRLVERALAEGLLILSGGTEGGVVSLSPPAVLTEREVAWAAEQLDRILRQD